MTSSSAHERIDGAPAAASAPAAVEDRDVGPRIDAEVAAVTRDLAHGVLAQVEAMLADPATDLPAEARAALAALADALAEQTRHRGTVTALDTPLARAWRAHPAERGR